MTRMLGFCWAAAANGDSMTTSVAKAETREWRKTNAPASAHSACQTDGGTQQSGFAVRTVRVMLRLPGSGLEDQGERSFSAAGTDMPTARGALRPRGSPQ